MQKLSYDAEPTQVVLISRNAWISRESVQFLERGRIAWQRASEALRVDHDLVEHHIGVGFTH